MKQGDYVGWIFGYPKGKDDFVAKGTILKRMPDGRYAVLFRSGSVQYFKETELRTIQKAEEK